MDIKAVHKDQEIRTYAVTVELEKREDGTQSRTLKGHAAVFDQETLIGSPKWGWDEVVRSGTFTETIKEDDVRALFNHDSNIVLGRNTSGTLSMTEDKTGLAVRIELPETQLIDDMVLAPIARGDISQMSFGFQVKKDKWTFSDDEDVRDKREILEVKLFDVSPVTFPAYEGTDIALASRSKSLEDIKPKTNWRNDILRRRLEILKVRRS